MDINIRNLHADDYCEIRELVRQVHSLHVSNRPDLYNDVDPLGTGYFDFLLSDKNTITLVAEYNTRVAGFCILTVKNPSANPLVKVRRVMCMDNLCVHQDFRNKGIGKRLFLEAKTRAEQVYADSMELSVLSFNEKAIEFYKDMGMSVKSMTMEMKIISDPARGGETGVG